MSIDKGGEGRRMASRLKISFSKEWRLSEWRHFPAGSSMVPLFPWDVADPR
jgi:hypothetical protein